MIDHYSTLGVGKNANADEIKKAYAKADTDEKLDNIETKLTGEWRASSILGAEELYKEFKGKQYTFHRGSAWVDKLQNHWKKLNQQEKLFTNINKWSPADIYMVSAAGARVDLTNAKNIADLNNMMITNLKSKDIIGVSLKIMKDKSHLSYYNFAKPFTNFVKYNNELLLNTQNNLKKVQISPGLYYLLYNFVRNVAGNNKNKLVIKEISPSRTELRLSFAKQSPPVFQSNFNHLPVTDRKAIVSVHPTSFE